MRGSSLLLLALAVVAGKATAQDEVPDLSFLEYLGDWQDGDEEWFVAPAIADIDGDGEQTEEETDDEDAKTTDED